MRLLKLTLSNFKGIRNFTLDTQGNNASVFGDNATGKTTLCDAYLWLLFGKDSQNKKDFDIKTLDANGNAIPGIDHVVEGVFEVDGRQLTLKKSFKEKWTKKRGTATAEFTGHSTDHSVDGVPVSEKDYNARTSQIASEETFKLLTNPAYFNTHLKWQDRRKILLDICGDLTDAEVIASDKSLSKLPEILQGRKLDDHRKIIAARRAEINKELQSLPVRIDEVQRGLPDISNFNPEDAKQMIVTLEKSLKTNKQRIIRIESGGEVAEKTKAIREIEGRLIDIQNRHRNQPGVEVAQLKAKLNSAKDAVVDLERTLKAFSSTIEANNKEIARLNERIAKLRETWHTVNGWIFEHEYSDTCPTCGQFLPAENVEEARKKALASFNFEKATKLEEINKEGKQHKARLDELIAEKSKAKDRIQETEDKLEHKNAEIAHLQEEINFFQEAADHTKDEAWIKAIEEKVVLEREIDLLKQGSRVEIEKIQDEISRLGSDINLLNLRLSDVDRCAQGQKRIEDLKAQERKLAAEYERLEGELYLTEQFIRTKVKMLEEKINSRFKMARFKMFNTLVNGGLEECCECLFEGVPYSSGLNNAARINVGIDIINTLSDHYGFTAPIFADNAEAVTKLIETRGQLIRLVVSEQDKILRVETDDKKI